MIKSIQVMNRFNVELFVNGLTNPPSNKFCLISISNIDDVLINESKTPRLRAVGCVKELPLQFTDITPEDKMALRMIKRMPNRFRLFDRTDAYKIISFLDEMNSLQESLDLIAHCQAGISRSGAVALFASKYLNVSFFDPYIDPNTHVLETLYSIVPLTSTNS